ncbi:MAG TPA: HAMP domain-containing methyl-accepting chemotaxis protein, partial [Azospirillaceae bacterium]|nr:HAMP domain-containing methyl-accepting chemotaxis protein [Azospirillaceae bacterium]
DLLHVRAIAAAWAQAEAAPDELAAFQDILAMVAAYETALDGLQAKKGGEEVSAADLETALKIDDRAAIAALSKLGGILRIDQQQAGHRVDDAFADMKASIFSALVVNTLLLLVLAVFFYWFTRWRIVHTLHLLDRTMARLAQGDHAVNVPLLDKRDELGDMARAVEVFKRNAIQNDQLNAEKQADQKRQAERAALREKITLVFGTDVDGVLHALAAASGKMTETAQAMAATAEQTATQAARAMSAAQSGAHNVETVASAATELAGSIAEIGRQVDQSAHIAETAVIQAHEVNDRVRGLAEVSARIGEVTDVISKIAEQTNLLALNASIEATRAGNAGKGFLVVANAVKNLARQTTTATEDIRGQVEAIQKATGDTVDAIQGIGTTITDISSITAAIAAAVEEQGAATDEIARNALGAAEMTKEVTANVSGVSEAAHSTGIYAHEVLEAAEDLSGQADKLGGDVSGFLTQVNSI